MTTAARPPSATLIRWSRNEFETYMRPRLPAFVAALGSELESVDEAQALSDLYELVHGESRLDWTVPVRGLRSELPTPCAISVAGVATSSVALVIQAAGIPAAVSRALATRIVDAAIGESPAIVVTLEAEVAALTGVDGIAQQASSVLALFASVANVVPLGNVAAMMTNELSPYHRLILSAVLGTQLDLWFATDSGAAVAELVVFDTVIAGLVISAGQAYEICHPGPYPSHDPVVPVERPAGR